MSCCPPLPERYAARIVRGEYVSFDKLTRTAKKRQDLSKQASKQPRKIVTGLASWLEAWNRFVGVIVATKPARGLEMIKYQTLITTAFQDYPAEACIEYDRCFRQLAAKDKKVPWDKYKEDIFVWCFSPKPTSTGWEKPQKHATIFVTANQPSCHVLAQPQTLSHTHPQEPKSASTSMPPGAVQEEKHTSSSTFATQEAVKGNTQPAGAPPSCSPLKQIITPLRLRQFAEELKFHTDPNWVKEILKGIDKSVSHGYQGLRCQRISRNLASASQHPQMIDEE